MTDFKFQHNVKLPSGDLFNVRGDDQEEFQSNLEFVSEIAELIISVTSNLHAVYTASAGDLLPGPAAPNVTVYPTPSGPAPAAAPAPGAQGDGGPTETVTDKWGNDWEYNNPAAPMTPRGPAVKKTATSQAGNRYSKWFDPAKGPRWFSERKPKPADHEIIQFEGFAR